MVSRTKKRIVWCQKADSGVGISTFFVLQVPIRRYWLYCYSVVKATPAASRNRGCRTNPNGTSTAKDNRKGANIVCASFVHTMTRLQRIKCSIVCLLVAAAAHAQSKALGLAGGTAVV